MGSLDDEQRCRDPVGVGDGAALQEVLGAGVGVAEDGGDERLPGRR